MKTQEIHNFKVGDTVTVFHKTIVGRFIIEGSSLIKKILDGEDCYAVEFKEPKAGGRYRYRYVDPNGQDDPEGYLTKLNAGDSK